MFCHVTKGEKKGGPRFVFVGYIKKGSIPTIRNPLGSIIAKDSACSSSEPEG
jgi:hypothetical protein